VSGHDRLWPFGLPAFAERPPTDAWAVGYTPSASTAVWIGTDTREPIRTVNREPVLGRTLPGSIWQTFMNAGLQEVETEPFSPFVPLGTPP
jgi:membrane peptidoglycan carboxypeptidase